MINIFFVPGMFGSTVEYMLRNFTNEFEPIDGKILEDGSMHSFKKKFHRHKEGIEKLFSEFSNDIDITSIPYPEETKNFNWIIENWPGDFNNSKNILITAFDKSDAELNLLFRYYKIAKGSLSLGLNMFFEHLNPGKWNEKYKHFLELDTWELRESFSLFYPEYINEFIEKDCSTIPNLRIIRNTDILYKQKQTFLELINFLNLSCKLENLDKFIDEWQHKQQYIVDEFNLIEKIVESALTNTNFDWSNHRLCLLSEAIIQHRLREQGYELKCYNLNSFPTNTKTLTNILEHI